MQDSGNKQDRNEVINDKPEINTTLNVKLIIK